MPADTSLAAILAKPRYVLTLIAASSVAALATALLAEYVFGITGCTLCLYQRFPYAATATLAGFGLLVPASPARTRRLLAACALLFAIGAALALYQVGTQQGWWTEPGVCAAPLPRADALVDLRQVRPERPACSEIDWSFLGLSLAAWNGLYAGALALGCALLAACGPRRPALTT